MTVRRHLCISGRFERVLFYAVASYLELSGRTLAQFGLWLQEVF